MIRPAGPGGRQPRRKGGEGELEVFVADEQDDHPVDIVRWEGLARAVLVTEGVSGDAELAVLFVDEPTMTELNGQFMGQTGPTDVLAFPIDDDQIVVGRSPDGSSTGPEREAGDDMPLLLGDVVICPSVAARNAPAHAGTYDDEIALLLVHGILHVLGMDHATEAETTEMQARERFHLDAFQGGAS